MEAQNPTLNRFYRSINHSRRHHLAHYCYPADTKKIFKHRIFGSLRVIASAWPKIRASGKAIRASVLGILTVALPFAFERVPEYLKRNDKCEEPNYESALQTGFYYHRLTRLNRPAARNKSTRLITVSDDSEGGPATHNGCTARELHARVLEKLIALRPAAIVLDYLYVSSTCPDASPESRHLAAAIRGAR